MFTAAHEYVYRLRICLQQAMNMFTAAMNMFITGHEYVCSSRICLQQVMNMFTAAHEYVYSRP